MQMLIKATRQMRLKFCAHVMIRNVNLLCLLLLQAHHHMISICTSPSCNNLANARHQINCLSICMSWCRCMKKSLSDASQQVTHLASFLCHPFELHCVSLLIQCVAEFGKSWRSLSMSKLLKYVILEYTFKSDRSLLPHAMSDTLLPSVTACMTCFAYLDTWGPKWRVATPPGGVTGGSEIPFTPDSLLPLTEEEVRRALRCSPEVAGADPCMGRSEKASTSDPGEVPTAKTTSYLVSEGV